MPRRPRWYSLPEPLRDALAKYLRRGETIQRPKREWIPDAEIYALWRSHLDAGKTGWQACILCARRYRLTPYGVSKIVKRFQTSTGDVY
jgi:hypothetical protein